MKKFIYVAAALSLAACTSEEIMEVDVPSAKVQKGITFEMGMPESDVLTRGGLTQQLNFFWFAETDKVNIYAVGAKKGNDNTSYNGIKTQTTWSPAVYKATKSEANAYLTAKDDANMLVFDGEKPAYFIGLYNATLEHTTDVAVTLKGGSGEDANDIISINSIKFTTDVQNQTVKMNEVIAPMWGISNGVTRNHDWESVGEKAQLQFERPFPVLKMSLAGTDDANEKYLKGLGKLRSIKVENKTAASTGYTLSQPYLTAASATYDTKDGGNWELPSTGLTDDNKLVTATIAGEGAEWKVEDAVNISILPVLAKEYKGNAVQGKNLKFQISWQFANKTITKEIEQKSPNDLATAHAVYDIRPLDLAKDAPYFLTNENKLYIFDSYQGKLRDLIKEGKIETTLISNITSIYSEVAFDDDDQNKLESFTGLKTLELVSEGQTSLNKQLPASLTEVNLPNVTTVGGTIVFDNITSLSTVTMPAFDFAANKTLTASILKAGSLVKLDMSGVSSMKEAYPKDGMTLNGFTKLTTVTNREGVVLGPESFKGCEALKSLSSYVELGGYGAFQGCTSLVKVAISSQTKIYDSTFKGATSLTTVNKENGQPIQPTEIGQYAFAETKTNIDLSLTTKIGASAFENVTTLKGTEDKGRGIWRIDVNAETIGEYAFKGCTGLKYVKFKNLTFVPSGLLNNCELTELKFAKVVEFDEMAKGGALGNLATLGNCKLFVNPGQNYSNNVLYGYYNERTKTYVEYAFKTIVEE